MLSLPANVSFARGWDVALAARRTGLPPPLFDTTPSHLECPSVWAVVVRAEDALSAQLGPARQTALD